MIGLRRPRKILHRHRLVAIYHLEVHRFMTKYELLRCNFLEPQRFRDQLAFGRNALGKMLAKATDPSSDPGSDTAKFCKSTSNVKLRLTRYRMFLFAANMLFRGGDAALAAGAARWVRWILGDASHSQIPATQGTIKYLLFESGPSSQTLHSQPQLPPGSPGLQTAAGWRTTPSTRLALLNLLFISAVDGSGVTAPKLTPITVELIGCNDDEAARLR